MPERVIECKPRPRDRIYIRLSGGRFFTIPQAEDLFVEEGQLLSDADVERLVQFDQYTRGRDKILRLLAIRARTVAETRTALDKIGIHKAIREGIVTEFVEKGLIDDRRFAHEYIRSRMSSKQLGPHRLRFELKRLGVAESIVDDQLENQVSSESQESMAWAVVHKKLAGRRPDDADIRRLGALLKRKGIAYDVINGVMYELLEKRRGQDEDVQPL